jgi:signal transduction histidine kinase
VDRITNGLTVGFQGDLAGFLEHVHLEDRSLFARSLVEADTSVQSAHRFEVRLVLPGGEARWFEFRGQSLEDATGRVGVVGTVADVDERRQAERDREALLAVLEQRNAELERFTFSVSHDLKSPLVTIRGFLGLLLEDLAAGRTERVASDAGRIIDATSRMQRLLDELLDLSRVGLQRGTQELFSARHAVDEALSAVQGRIDDARVRVEIEPDLPMLFGDRQRIIQVLQNLIDNAASFMAGQPSPRIVIGVRSGGRWPVITVKDNGIGIDPKYAERIFDLFEKLDPRSGGTGVGLALVRRIVQHHGGEVWVESEGEGSGSTFCFTLPPGPAGTAER